MDRQGLARFGEDIAARFLLDRGAELVARNRSVGRGEIDLVVRFGKRLAAVEVKTRTSGDPREAFTDEKAAQVRQIAGKLGVRRVDYIGVSVKGSGVGVHWVRNAG